MTDTQIDEGFGSITPDYPIWKAVTELAQQAVDRAVESVSVPHLTDAFRQYAAGELFQALQFRNQLYDRMEDVQKRNLSSAGAAKT